MGSLRVTEVRFSPARPDQIEDGHLGFVAVVLDGELKLDGIALRRTRDGRRALSFPRRRDQRGFEHPYIRPLTDEARIDLERQVFEALRLGSVAP